ncbi:MAG: 3'(2'),5'-bisphosphate nucleotidase [Phycisphaerales bacterium]
MLTEQKKTEYLVAAVEAVALAARVTQAVQKNIATLGSVSKDDRSPVTVADFAAQAVVSHHLCESLRVSPDVIRIVGEESAGILRTPEKAGVLAAVVEAVRTVWNTAAPEQVLDAIDACDHDATTSAYWTLDPIDGTKGFLRNQQYAISLAWIANGKVDIGVMGCPNLSDNFDHSFDDACERGQIFFAVRSQGAWSMPIDQADETDLFDPRKSARPLNRAKASRVQRSDERIRVCESVESGHTSHDDTARILTHLGGAGTPARLDSQAKYAVVARGQADAYLRLPTRPGYVEKIWDHAAGMLVAQEAGVTVTDITGALLDFSQGATLSRNQGVICAAPEFHEKIILAIGALGMTTPGVTTP